MRSKKPVNEVLQKMNDALQKENDVLRQLNEVLQGTNEDLRQLNDVLQRSNEVLEKRNDVLQQSNEVLQKRNDVLQQSNEVLPKQNEVLQVSGRPLQPMSEVAQEQSRVLEGLNGEVQRATGGKYLKKRKKRLVDLLMLLWEKGSMTVMEMMKVTGTSEATISRTIEVMKKHGWIRFEGYRQKGRFVLSDGLREMIESWRKGVKS